VSGRPVPYKDLLDAAKHAAAFIWQVPGAEHITIRIEPSSSGFWAIFRHDFESNPWWDGSKWQTDTRYVHEMYRWKIEAAIPAAQALLIVEKAKATVNAKRHAERAARARQLADAVNEFLDPIREQVSA
jgi:hypothetical protein